VNTNASSECPGLAATIAQLDAVSIKLQLNPVPACQACSHGRGCGLGLLRNANAMDETRGTELVLPLDTPGIIQRVGGDHQILAMTGVSGMGNTRRGLRRRFRTSRTLSETAEALTVGEQVWLVMPRRPLFEFIFFALLLPALLTVAMAGLGHELARSYHFSTDLGALAGLIGGLLAGVLLARFAYTVE